MISRGEGGSAESVKRTGNSEVLDRRLDQLIGRLADLMSRIDL